MHSHVLFLFSLLFLFFSFFLCFIIWQLNEVLAPNPFNRPRAVLLLEVTGAEGI